MPDQQILFGWTEIRRWFVLHGVPVHVRTLQTWRAQQGLPVVTIEFMREVVAQPANLQQWLDSLVTAKVPTKPPEISRSSATPRETRRR